MKRAADRPIARRGGGDVRARDAEPPRDVLDLFAPATAAWFRAAFAAPTRVQREGWPRIAAGAHALLLAPTGSGKTLAAFLYCIDRLGWLPQGAPARRGEGVRVLYISPLKALAYDIERNLRAPLVGIRRAAEGLGLPFRGARVAVRTGDTPPREREQLKRDPADILITTPESLYLLLGTAARAALRSVETVIVDEIHAVAATKRGAHLALSLERLVELTGRDVQRIGLSATQRPLDEVARFLAGERPVEIVDASEPPHLDLTIEVPVEDMERPPIQGAAAVPPDAPDAPELPRGKRSRGERPPAELGGGGPGGERGIWPAIYPRLLDLIRAHRSTIVFTNSRSLCERLAQRVNELAGAPLVRAHHGSIARAQRLEIEEMLKDGRLRGLVATSSLELGIDMGAVDLVLQIESPGAVARGLQRVGRAGHQVGARSIGRIFPKYRGDLLEAAVVARGMLDGAVEPIRVPRCPLDVLAQQIVAMCAVEELPVDTIERVVRRAYSFRDLSRDLLVSVLDMLAGRYPSDAFADLRPRLVWDRSRDLVSARRDARLLALVNGGTIPDRGMYGVHIGPPPGGARIGELDEEMVHESRVGQTFLLGATTWRIVEITRDRVIVTPAPGEPGKMPFWHGDGPGRPLELGRTLGAFVRTLGELRQDEAVEWLGRDYRLESLAARNLWRYVDEQRRATGTLPTDRSITIERFRDELGDWRVCILTPFGARVHAPWALVLEAKLARTAGFEVQALWSDDGIALRFADTEEMPDAAALLPDPDEIEDLVLDELGRSALFATHFRENAARALLLPRRRPGTRTPLWSQRLRAQNLLAVAAQYPRFPIVLETYRECLHDVFDLPALTEVLRGVRGRTLRVVDVETPSASPFARSLAFAWVAAYLYEGDAPLAERRAQALTLDRNLLRDLLGGDELRDLLDPAVLDEVEAELQGLEEGRRARHPDALHDLLRRIGHLAPEDVQARCAAPPAEAARWIDELVRTGRACRLRLAGRECVVAVEDVARYRDALGASPPPGLPAAFLERSEAPLEGLLARHARTHAPFTAAEAAARFGLLEAQAAPVLRALVAGGRLLEGAFRPGATGGEREYCDADVLRVLRRRTLARLRNEVAPVDAAVLARFLPRWHGVELAPARGGLPRLREVIEQLEGLALPFSELERSLLPARVGDFHSRMLDELGALGEIVWIGRGALGGDDGRIALYRRDRVPLLLDASEPPSGLGPVARALLDHLEARGASFFLQLSLACPAVHTDEVLEALWDLVWAGLVTNDTFQPLRALGAPKRSLRARARSHVVEAGGRWSTVSQLRAGAPDGAPGDTEKVHARAMMLLERYGVVSRDAVAAESLPGGFASVAPVLRAMEEAGRLRRGHFVEGLSGAQYAQAGAVERLRAARDEAPEAVVLAAVDPANPYGALLPWPGSEHAPDGAESEASRLRPRRVAGASVVLVGGVPVLYLESGGHGLRFFGGSAEEPGDLAGADEATIEMALAALRTLAARQRHHELRVERIDGVPALASAHARRLEQAGFRAEPGRLVLHLEE